jgi:serine/threonine-protein kinase
MVMEALRGRNLKEILVQDGPQPGPRVADIACQVLSALGTAHRTGIIHRDIKPANIFVCEGGPVPSQAKLLDFGIAKLLSQKRLTREGLMLGTLSYVSPEQARGTPVDPRSDLFSLGVSMFEALAGEKPFGGLRDTDVLQRILSGTRKSLDEVAPHLDPGLVEIVERALCRSPGDRYESAEAMADALADHVPKKVSARPAPKPDPEPAPESLPKTRRW